MTASLRGSVLVLQDPHPAAVRSQLVATPALVLNLHAVPPWDHAVASPLPAALASPHHLLHLSPRWCIPCGGARRCGGGVPQATTCASSDSCTRLWEDKALPSGSLGPPLAAQRGHLWHLSESPASPHPPVTAPGQHHLGIPWAPGTGWRPGSRGPRLTLPTFPHPHCCRTPSAPRWGLQKRRVSLLLRDTCKFCLYPSSSENLQVC